MEFLAKVDSMLYWFGSQQRPGLNEAAVGLTQLGGIYFLFGLSVVITLFFAWRKRYRFAVGFALVALIAAGVNFGTKVLVGRPRPDVGWRLIKLPSGDSFPSGHALCSIAIYTTAFALFGHMTGRRLAWAGVALGLLIGLTRPYLGVHYPSDVVGGWVAGLGLALLGLAFILKPEPIPPSSPQSPSPPGG